MDSGDIIAQSRIKISPFDTIRSLQRKVYKTEPKLVLKAIQNIEKNIPPKVQNEKKASVFPNRRRPKDSQLDTSKTLEELINYIRACDPEKYPAYFKYQRKKLFIKIWRAKKPEKDKDML
jgi:methionyl-tRNA formyltransferase